MDKIAASIGYLTCMIIGVVFNGVIVSWLWEWFIVEGFGVAPISIPIAIGISLLGKNLTVSSATFHDSGESIGFLFGWILGKGILVLSIGWIVTKFI